MGRQGGLSEPLDGVAGRVQHRQRLVGSHAGSRREHRADQHERESDAIPTVNGSSRIATPRSAATAGFTYVITVARTGPTSAISAKNSTNASAVQTTASVSTDAITFDGGRSLGSAERRERRVADAR